MSERDFDFAVRLTQAMEWNFVAEDFRFMLQLEPRGCFVLREEHEKIGIATAISFGKIGWFGNLIVDETRRGKGAGTALVKHSVEYLTGKGVKTVGLYAYMNRIRFYERIGFKRDLDFVALKGMNLVTERSRRAERARRTDWNRIIERDAQCFGQSRERLLHSILKERRNLCYIYEENGEIQGHVLAKVYSGMAELGPLFCPPGKGDVAIELLRTAVRDLAGLEVYGFLPSREITMLDTLRGYGFVEDFRVARMFYGPALATTCVYMGESLERG